MIHDGNKDLVSKIRILMRDDPMFEQELDEGIILIRGMRDWHFSIFFDTRRWRMFRAVDETREGCKRGMFSQRLVAVGIDVLDRADDSAQAQIIINQMLIPLGSHHKLAVCR